MSSARFQKLRARIECARNFYEDRYKGDEERNLDFYKGKQWGNEWAQMADRVTTNVILPVIRAIIPSIIFQYPRYSLNTQDPTLIGACKVAQIALNDYFRVLKGKITARRCVMDSLVFRFGVAKVGWNYLEEEVALTQEEQNQELSEMLDGMLQSGEPIPDLATSVGLIRKKKLVPIKDTPTITRISPKRFWPDPDLESLRDMADYDSYVIEEQALPLERVKADKRYKKKVKLLNELDGTVVPEYVSSLLSEEWRNEFKRIRLRHIYYYENSRLYYAVFAEDQEEPLWEDDERGGLVQFPFALLKNIDVPDQLAGISEVQDLRQLQRNRNKLATIILDHDKKFLRKIGLLDSADPDGIAENALKHPETGTIVRLQSPQDVFPIPNPEVPGDLWKSLQMIDADIEKRTQVSAYNMGLLPDQKRLATEVTAMNTAASAISEDRLNNTVDFLGDVGRMLLRELQVNLSPDRWAEVSPQDWQQILPFLGEMPDGIQMLNRAPKGVMPQDSRNLFVQYGREHIQGEFTVEVVVGSTLPESENVKTKRAMDRYNLFRKDPLINAPLLLEESIEATGVKRNPKDYIVMPPPMPEIPGEPLPPQAEHGGVMNEPFTRSEAVNSHMMNRGYDDADIQRGVRMSAV